MNLANRRRSQRDILGKLHKLSCWLCGRKMHVAFPRRKPRKPYDEAVMCATCICAAGMRERLK